jgi:hypothetical protein
MEQDLDVPWFIKRWNQNKKQVFKPKMFVERIRKKIRPKDF